MSRIITAIDIGSTNVKALIAVKDDDADEPKVIGEATHPTHGIKKGEITGIDEAIDSIANALTGAERMAGLTVSSTYVSINGKNIVSNNNRGIVAIADSNSEILEEDVIRALEQAKTIAIPESREILHLIPREFIIDQHSGIKNPIGMTGSRLEVDAHIVSVPTTAMHNLERCVQSIGLRMDGAVFTGWAASRAVLTPTEKELGVLLIDMGGGTTSITTFVEDAVTYSASIPFGGSNVTRDLAAGLRISLDDAEKVKLSAEELTKKSSKKKGKDEDTDVIDIAELGIGDIKTVSRKLFSEIVEARIEEIFHLIIENIESSGNEYKLPAGVVITGGSADIPNITSVAKRVFGMPARLGQPRGLSGLTEGVSTPRFSVLWGLILHGLEDEENFSTYSNTTAVQGGSGVFSRVGDFLKNLLP